jgi:hypothetical protein
MASSEGDDGPPLFPSWGHWYALVIGTLAVLITAFTWLSRTYR